MTVERLTLPEMLTKLATTLSFAPSAPSSTSTKARCGATEHREKISWTEIVPPERIALFRGDPNVLESVLTFTPDGARTRIE